MINFQLLDDVAYKSLRYATILKAEASVRPAYLDTYGIPSIGIGFNLRDDNLLLLVLKAFGLDTTKDTPLFAAFQEIVAKTYNISTAQQKAASTTALLKALGDELVKQPQN